MGATGTPAGHYIALISPENRFVGIADLRADWQRDACAGAFASHEGTGNTGSNETGDAFDAPCEAGEVQVWSIPLLRSYLPAVIEKAVSVTAVRICNAAGGALDFLKIGAYVIGAVAVIIYLYLIPVMAAFEDTLPHLIRNAFYFMGKKPWKAVVILFFDIFPFVLTFSDLQSLPLYAFLWVLCGFGLQAMLAATLLLPVFAPYLDAKAEDRNEDPSEESEEYPMTEEEILEDMRKLGM